MAKQTFTTGQVLTAAQMTSLQQTAMLGGDASVKVANYTLVAADAGTTVAMNSASTTTITVNTGLFAAGDTVFIQNRGAGVCTVTAGTATVACAGSLALPQNDAGILYFTSASAATFYDFIQVGATSPLTTKGDLYGYSTSDARIPIGANNTVLTADSSEALGLKWAAPAGGGKVLQVVEGTKTGYFDTTSTSYQDTGLSVAITPSSATSKVLIMAVLAVTGKNAGNSLTALLARLVRTSTSILFAGERNQFTNSSLLSNGGSIVLNKLDSPATTSATTYKVEIASSVSGQGVWINDYTSNNTTVSTIIAMEIGA